MLEKRLTVNLDDFIKYVLKKWKTVIIIMVVCGVFFTGGAIMFGQKIVVQPSERYLELQEQKTSIEDYIENSIFMRIDPMNINQRVIYIKNVSDRELLKDFVLSGEIWGDIREEIPAKYLIELITWSETETIETIEIKVSHAEPEKCDEYAGFLVGKLQNFDEKADITLGTKFTVSEEAVMKEQRRQYKLLDDINSELEYTAAGYTIEVSIISTVIVGGIFGALLSVSSLFAIYMVFGKREIHRIN